MHSVKNPIHSALLGLAVGDALGVPVEFESRATLKENPVQGMRAYGTYNQPAGTWSDDSSMAFCIAENLLAGYDLTDMATRFVNWKYHNYWTPHGELFDIGNATSLAVADLRELLTKGQPELLKGLYTDDEMANGNGALMRCIPLLFYIKDKSMTEKFEIAWEVSALTHGHIRSGIACFFYLLLAEYLLEGEEKRNAYHKACTVTKEFLAKMDVDEKEQAAFARVLNGNIHKQKEENIESSGYVMHSLEASLWCFLRFGDYPSTVLAAVNLGHDTDTTGAITGGLAGLYYGIDLIPEDWIDSLARLEDILELAEKMRKKFL